MINLLKIHNFKSIKKEEFHFKNLNLLAGTNSSGKSSVIQALLLAIDNITDIVHAVKDKNMSAIHVPAISFNELRNYITNAKQYNIELACGQETSILTFNPKDDNFIGTVVEQQGYINDEDLRSIRNVVHLSAIRSGDLNAPKINPNPDNATLGLNGEYLIDYYYNHRKDVLERPLLYYKESKTLEGQVNYWMRKLTGYTLHVENIDSEYRVRYLTPSMKGLQPYNVGTGVNFIMQTIVACLVSNIDGIVIIENPEIHLHPAAQASVLDFFVDMAKAGIQLFIESHSDHLFNGIRRSLKNGAININQVAVFYFTKQEDWTTSVRNVQLSQYGGIEDYIPGMFSQFDEDLDAILS